MIHAVYKALLAPKASEASCRPGGFLLVLKASEASCWGPTGSLVSRDGHQLVLSRDGHQLVLSRDGHQLVL